MKKEYPVWLMDGDIHIWLNGETRIVHDDKGHDLLRWKDGRLYDFGGKGSIEVRPDGRLVNGTGNQIGFITDYPDFLRSNGASGDTTRKAATQTTAATAAQPKKKGHGWLLLLLVIGAIYLFVQNQQKAPKIYDSFDEAALAVRQSILNHEEDVVVKYRASAKPENQFIEADRLFEKAVAHTGNPNEGDHLGTGTRFPHLGSEYAAEVDGKGCVVTMGFDFSYFITKEEDDALSKRIKSIVDGLNISGLSDYQKVRAIYNWITTHVTYDYARLEDESYLRKYSAYNAVFEGTAVCNAYAQLFYRMALTAGLDARIVVNSGLNHSYNIVRVDGLYYFCDVTWDSGVPESQYGYFLRGWWDFKEHIGQEIKALSWGTYLSQVIVDYNISNEMYGK